MNPVGHFLFGAAFAGFLIDFLVELPKRRRGEPRCGLARVLVAVVLIGCLAAFPQVSRFIGDHKLDEGPSLNLFVFHDFLELVGQRFRLGEGLLDPPVTVSAVCLGLSFMLLVYLRSNPSRGWDNLWRDATYLTVVVVCLILVRSVVSGSSYLFEEKLYVSVHGRPYMIVGSSVLTLDGKGAFGRTRDKALCVRDAFLAVNSTRWIKRPREVDVFLHGQAYPFVPPLEYNSLVSLVGYLMQSQGLAPPSDIQRIISAGTLPRRDIPLSVVFGLPVLTAIVALYAVRPDLFA